ncbi:MAG: 50S ribosomal protein L18 [Patescibacteria group bacterium]
MNRKKINQKKIRRSGRVRARIKGTDQRPRMSVFRSGRRISVQVIDDAAGHTVAAAHGEKGRASGERVGEAIAQKCLEKKISRAVFDRGRYRYHGTVKAVAEAARKGGLAL